MATPFAAETSQLFVHLSQPLMKKEGFTLPNFYCLEGEKLIVLFLQILVENSVLFVRILNLLQKTPILFKHATFKFLCCVLRVFSFVNSNKLFPLRLHVELAKCYVVIRLRILCI